MISVSLIVIDTLLRLLFYDCMPWYSPTYKTECPDLSVLLRHHTLIYPSPTHTYVYVCYCHHIFRSTLVHSFVMVQIMTTTAHFTSVSPGGGCGAWSEFLVGRIPKSGHLV